VHPAPGFPRALSSEEGRQDRKTLGKSRRGNGTACVNATAAGAAEACIYPPFGPVREATGRL